MVLFQTNIHQQRSKRGQCGASEEDEHLRMRKKGEENWHYLQVVYFSDAKQ